MPFRIAINGFGRIGRQLTRLLCSDPRPGLCLSAINTMEDCATAAHLLKYDSIQGIMPMRVTVQDQELQLNHLSIPVFHEPVPGRIPWQRHKIDLVIECSGHFTTEGQAVGHLEAGAGRVVISAAADEPDITICIGVNHKDYQADHHRIISASSCTTNCLAPLAKVIDDHWGIAAGLATFIHSSTNSQHLLDTKDSDLRRARAANQNLIPGKTSAAHQIPLVIPCLKGKFDALSIRVPTPHVHLADFTARLNKPIARTDFFNTLEEISCGDLRGIMRVSHEPLVSIDFKNSLCSCVIDAAQTIIKHDMVKVLVWHANEFSYCQRIIDLVNFIAMNT